MNSFEYAAPKSVEVAAELLAPRWGQTEVMAGGTDLVTCLKQGLSSPSRVVSLRNIKELRGISTSRGELRIGATTTLGEVARHRSVRQHFPAITTAIEGIGSPQILAAGTVGGDLCQRPRCWYYRNGLGLLANKGALVKEGDNRYHAIFNTSGPALFVNPSSLGPALIALGASLGIAGPGGKTRALPAAEFFKAPRSENERETVLQPNELLTEIRIPLLGRRNATFEVRHRQGFDWPYVTASAAFDLKSGVASNAVIVLGHVAPTPWVAAAAARAINGSTVNADSAARAGQAASEGAQPLSGNAYKVQMVKAAVKRALLAAA